MAERLPMETAITFQQENPKKAGAKSHTRYEAYKVATTVQQAFDLGAVKGDIAHDFKSGFLTVAPGQHAAAGGAAIPVEPPVVPKRVYKKPVKKEVVEPPAVRIIAVRIMGLTVPEGMAPGQVFTVQGPNGRIQLQVPAGLQPGQAFHFVQAPPGAVPGTVLQARTPNGPIQVQVPAGGGPGQVFIVDNAAMIPPPPPPMPNNLEAAGEELRALRQRILKLEGKIAAHGAQLAELTLKLGREMSAEEAACLEVQEQRRCMENLREGLLSCMEAERRQVQTMKELYLQLEKRLKLHMDNKEEQAPAVNGAAIGEEEPPAAPERKAANKEVVGEKEVVVKQEIAAAPSPMKRAADFEMPAAKRPANNAFLETAIASAAAMMQEAETPQLGPQASASH